MDMLIRPRFGLPLDPWRDLHLETADIERVGMVAHAAASVQAMVSVVGPRGSGKTHAALHALRGAGALVVQVQRLDREQTRMGDVVAALVTQLSDQRLRLSGELRTGQLCTILGQTRRPVVLVVDDLHVVHYQTILGLKRLRELAYGDRKAPLLGIVMLGQRDRIASLPEVALRTSTVVLGGLGVSEMDEALRRAVGGAFAPEARRRLAAAAPGVWIDLQDLADLAMVKAAERGERKVSVVDVGAALSAADGKSPADALQEAKSNVDDALSQLEGDEQ